MAKTALATKNETTGISPADQAAALAEFLDGVDLAQDGLEEIEGGDIKIAALVFNMKGVDKASGDPIPPNVYYNTVTETTKKKHCLVLLTLHKSHEWREYDEGEKRSKIRCKSLDRQTGVTDGGVTRTCQGCPDYQWQTTDGKRTRRCGDVWNVAAVDRETNEPVVIRFKKSSLDSVKTYFNRHFIGRLTLPGGKRANVPLFAMETYASLKMSDDGKYAIPVLETGDLLPKAEILSHQQAAKDYREVIIPALAKLADKDTDGSDESGSSAVNPNDFIDVPADGVPSAAW